MRQAGDDQVAGARGDESFELAHAADRRRKCRIEARESLGRGAIVSLAHTERRDLDPAVRTSQPEELLPDVAGRAQQGRVAKARGAGGNSRGLGARDLGQRGGARHLPAPLGAPASWSRWRLNRRAEASSSVTIITVSSPATEPSRPSKPSRSMARATPLA